VKAASNIRIRADSPEEQKAAHTVLGEIAFEVKSLDLALKSIAKKLNTKTKQITGAYIVQIGGRHFFVERSEHGQINNSTFFQISARQLTHSCAEQVVRALANVGYVSASIHPSPVAGRDFEDEFTNVWILPEQVSVDLEN